MAYKEAKEIANNVKTPTEADEFLKSIELDNNITDMQYYWLRHLAYSAAYGA